MCSWGKQKIFSCFHSDLHKYFGAEMKMFGIEVEAQKRARYENRCEDEHNRGQIMAVRCLNRPLARYLSMLPDIQRTQRAFHSAPSVLHTFPFNWVCCETHFQRRAASIHAARVRCLICVGSYMVIDFFFSSSAPYPNKPRVSCSPGLPIFFVAFLRFVSLLAIGT